MFNKKSPSAHNNKGKTTRSSWWPFGEREETENQTNKYGVYLRNKWGDEELAASDDDHDYYEDSDREYGVSQRYSAYNTDYDDNDDRDGGYSHDGDYDRDYSDGFHQEGDVKKRRWWWPFGTKEDGNSYSDNSVPYRHNDQDVEEAPKPRGIKAILKKRSRWWWISRSISALLLLFIITLLWLLITAPLSKSLEPIAPPQLTLTASDGTPIARNGAMVDKPVKIADLPEHVTNPFLAIEDRRFYSHWGVDPRGLARAFWTNLTSDRTQGGSTITQQLAKFTFLNSDRTLSRKGRELLIAFWLEARLSKDEILERYLSNAYFGDNVYGIRAASLHYFYRQPERLKPEQAMMLAGLLQAPSRFAPTKNLKAAQKRARIVRKAMVAGEFITQAQADKLPKAAIDVRTKNTLPTGTYFADWAMPQARALADHNYAKQTLSTTLDAKLQRIARRSIGRAGLGKAQIALVAMRPTGEVVAMVGGRSYKKSAFNRVSQAKRQPGSTFKSFVWLSALQSGMRPDSMVDDSEMTDGSYRPKNAGGKYRGEITLKDAFAKSSNVAAVRLFNDLGSKRVIRTAKSLGVESNLAQDDPSLALGTSTMTLLELTAAYAGIASNSYPVEPRAFDTEEDGWFSWLFDGKSSLDSRVHEDMEEMLRHAVNKGTGRNAQLRIANFGKTGTSQDNRDAIFVGYAGDLVVGIWVGNDDNSPLKGTTGGGTPARIWRDFMTQAVKGAGYTPPAKPKKTPKADEPIKPLDLPEIPDLPEGNIEIGNSDLKINEDDGFTLSTQIDGQPIDINVNSDGLDIKPRE